MQIHASCVARTGHGILLLGPSGAGKSDLAIRLIGAGFSLVADDRVDLDGHVASPPAALAGLIELRGLGIVALSHEASVTLVLAFALGVETQRLPEPMRAHSMIAGLDIPLIRLDPRGAAAVDKVGIALDCATGRLRMVAGALFSDRP